MADVEHTPIPHGDEAEVDSGLESVAEISSEVEAVQAEADVDSASLISGNEVHASERHEDDVAEDTSVHSTHEEGGVNNSETVGAPGPSQEAGEETSANKSAQPAEDDDKTVKKAPVSTKSSPVKAGRPSVGSTLVRKSNIPGAGTAKPSASVVSKAASSSSTTKPVAPSAVRKSISSTNATASKPASTTTIKAPVTKTATPGSAKSGMFIRPTTTATATPSTTSRRPSLPPKPPLTASPAKRASPETNNSRSVISPTGSTGTTRSGTLNTPSRPRASVTESLPSRRTSLGAKPAPPTPTRPSAVAKRSGTASVSSLREIAEDQSVNQGLQKKLRETQDALSSQTSQFDKLKVEATTIREQLETALKDVETRKSETVALQTAKDGIEAELASQKQVSTELRSEIDSITLKVNELEEKLIAAEGNLQSKEDQILQLEGQYNNLTSEYASANNEISTFKLSASEAATASAAAAVEHEALVKAKADLEAIKAETDSLVLAHKSAIEEANAKIRDLEVAVGRSDELSRQLVELKEQKEELANKLSEAEVEILELKEAAEKAEDEEHQAQNRIKALEQQISESKAASDQAAIVSKKQVEEHERALADAQRSFEEALKTSEDGKDALSLTLKSVNDELAAANVRHEQAIVDAKAAEEAHAAKVEETEKLHAQKAEELSTEIQRLAKELAGQEASYALKVNAVKEEHDRFLQEAFQKAKTEAGDAHAQDLHSLRTQSQTMIEQLNAAHKSYIEELKKEHEEALDLKVKALEKSINNQALELKATQDDLAKAKSAVSSSAAEIESLKKQLAEADKAAANITASSASEHASEVLRLKRELSSASDESVALKEVLNVQKDSISEMSNNHQRELEQVAKTRAEEVMALRAQHEAEVNALMADRTALTTRVTDLEGELATLQASMAAQASASASRSNGVTPPGGSSNVTKEDLKKLHDTHNLKVLDLEAQHERVVTSMRGDLEAAVSRTDGLQEEVDRRSMEIKYLEADNEEKDDTITRLKEDIAQLSEQLEKYRTGQVTA